jgi:2-polyprenyl-6-methoxyphenol hydroxylase-like FAD-dependent oxidoreductase
VIPSATSVLIAGGGPVGLATAVELGTRGIDCVVLEPRAAVDSLRPRAKTSSVRTMEHFRRWGLADRVRELADLPVSWSQEAVFCTTLLGPEITRFGDCFGLAPRQRPEFAESGQQVAQPVVERVLREAVAALPSITFAEGWALRSLEESDEAVVVEAAGPNGTTRRITAQYVVGCDGPDSTTRAAIGARLLGSADGRCHLSIVFRAPGLAERVSHGPAVHYWVFNPRVVGVLGRFNLADTWWAGVTGAGDGNGRGAGEVIGQLLGEPVDCEILRTDHWNARMQLADTLQSNRAFLAGDAAHLNPPWGGHGYNTGIGDAVNIGWKLAATLQGWGGAALRQSYGPERSAVAERTIIETTLNMRAVLGLRPDAELEAAGTSGSTARHNLAQALQQGMNGEFHSLGLVLGYEYTGSPVVVPDHAEPSLPDRTLSAYTPSTRPGARLPHAWLPDGRSAYDTLGTGLTLLRFDGHAGCTALVEAAHRRAIPLTVVEMSDRGTYQGVATLLVRPDHHIGWRSPGTELTPEMAHAVLDRILGWS